MFPVSVRFHIDGFLNARHFVSGLTASYSDTKEDKGQVCDVSGIVLQRNATM